jgi:23S rRNA (cytosine1962-C5)-methyltransferase
MTRPLKLHVTAAAQRRLRSGHPWLFADSIIEQNREGRAGELTVVYDRHDRLLGLGLFDPLSPIRVRLLHIGRAQTLNDEWWRGRLEEALSRRDGLFDPQTTGYRWIHGESDGWPGLVLDRYDATLVLKIYTVSWLPRLAELTSLFVQRLRPERLVLRLSRNISSTAKGQFERKDGDLLHGIAPQEPVIFLESGLRFEADVLQGQKTGFFLDQRENRRRVQELAQGRDLLNAFSFSGGFSVYAARGGAHSVTDLDISQYALRSARRNLQLNGSHPFVRSCPQNTIQAEAFEWLSNNHERKFDMIVLDPPSLAKRQHERTGALRAYYKLVLNALSHIRLPGILVVSSCSAHVPAEEFFRVVRSAALDSHQSFSVLQTTRHPSDHPATFEEAEYLKAIYLALKKSAKEHVRNKPARPRITARKH